MRPIVRSLVVLLLALTARAADAQIIETPVPFDSAGKIRTLTPGLVSRLGLAAPAWPASGDFVEARLFESSLGGQVLVVEREHGRIERYSLTADHLTALRFAIDAGMRRSGAPVSDERMAAVAQPARGSFVRNQMLLTWGVYGPLLAALAGDPKGGTALVLLATGASYFATTALSRKTVITASQNHLASDGALRGVGVGMGALYAAVGDANSRSYAAAGLAGALAGQIAGFQLGKRLTIGEAEAATSMSTYAAATAMGLTGASGLINEVDDGRGAIGAMIGAGLIGYALGPSYPRRASYTVTRGDIQLLSTGAILGVGIGVTPFLTENIQDEKPFFASATLGMLGGLFLVERQWVRPFDHTTGDAGETSIGMGAGALMGAGIGVLSDANVQAMVGLMTGGGVLGALVAHNLAAPARAGATRLGVVPALRGARVSWDPSGLALTASGVPGQHALLRLTF